MLWKSRGYDVTLVGRQYPNPDPVDRPYATRKLRCRFHRGALFYLEYQIRLWWQLRTLNPDVYLANDLDTLGPNAYWAYRCGKPLVYDSHEYFIGVPELQGRTLIQRAWRAVERYGLPRADAHVTVNPSIAQQYFKEYGQSFEVVRNMPMLPEGGLPFGEDGIDDHAKTRQRQARTQLNLPLDRDIWLLQGAGINVDRGAEELAEAAAQRPSVLLLFVGSGDAIPELQRRYGHLDNIQFVGRQPLEILRQYTSAATLGFSLDKPLSLNYEWSLPNKLFDYWQAGIPVIASDLVEVGRVVRATGAGKLVSEVTSDHILHAVDAAMTSYDALTTSARRAAHHHHWGQASQGWHRIIDQLEGKSTVHIWSMDRLEPPPYGGTLEVRGQVQRAAQAGARVILHAWSKSGRSHDQPWSLPGLKVDVLPRRRMGDVRAWRLGQPWIVQSRRHIIARHRMRTQKGAIIANGIHCTAYPLPHNATMRVHNPEAAYYQSLAKQASGWRALYFRLESARLRRWERQFARTWRGEVWALSIKDARAWEAFGGQVQQIIPPLAAFECNMPEDAAETNRLLVPGKFSVAENEAAARWTLALQGVDALIWAGHGLTSSLRQSVKAEPRIQYLEAIDDDAMRHEFASATAVLIHSEHVLGVKLKLIQAMCQSRWILAHEYSVEGLGIELEPAAIVTYHDAASLQDAWNRIRQSSWDAQRASTAYVARQRYLEQRQLPIAQIS